jgi:TDG/mug DNA glycosylase family protein
MSKRDLEQPPGWFRPTKAQLQAARAKTVPDIISPGLKVLFVGINPGLYTAAIGHHFGRPGNRFWPALHAGGFTRRLLSPFEERELLSDGYGITNVVSRATATADELNSSEVRAGGRVLSEKILKNGPRWVAILGVMAYRAAFDKPKAQLGPQPEKIGASRLWLLPNPSGLNAHYQAGALAKMFRRLHVSVDGRSEVAS